MMTHTITCQSINTLWYLLIRRAYKKFLHATYSPGKCQEKYLLELMKKNAATAYGRRFNFAGITNIEQFQRNIPLTTYEDYRPYIEKVAQGEDAVLTREKVKLFEPSSGSISAAKFIPYTKSLRHEFQQGIAPWIFSLYQQFPKVKKGKAYWSISPPTNGKKHYGKMPVGFDDDSSYLGFLGKRLYSQVAVTIDKKNLQGDVSDFMAQTLLALLAEKNIRLISVWSPTFLTLLCDYFLENEHAILARLSACAAPGAQKRAKEIGNRQTQSNFNTIWPHLELISCWTDATSREPARRLRSLFPAATIQGKGLLATEAFVSFSFQPGCSPVLAITSHFFEFLATNGKCLAAHQVKEGETYSIVVTTGGGLYRYKLGDSVRVDGFIGKTPTLKFLGKSDSVSDLFGEKLNALHAAEIINALLSEYNFAMLAPDKNGSTNHYTLYVESGTSLPPLCIELLEEKLCANPNYLHCIRTGQLTRVKIFKIRNAAHETYTARLMEGGMRLGDIKPTALSKLDNWSHYFTGTYETP